MKKIKKTDEIRFTVRIEKALLEAVKKAIVGPMLKLSNQEMIRYLMKKELDVSRH